MAFDDIVRSGVALANSFTSSLQPTVQHHSWLGFDGENDVYNPPETIPALVTIKTVLTTTSAGQVVESRASVLFLKPRLIKTQDKIILPDGSTGPILDIQGIIDPNTNMPYAPKVYLG